MSNRASRNEGEGNKTAARRYNRAAERSARTRDSAEHGRKAREELEGERGGELVEAERRGRERSRGDDAEPRATAELDELDPEARREAIARASALMEQGYGEVPALRMGVALAKEWVDSGRPGGRAGPGRSQHVMHERQGWVIYSESGSESGPESGSESGSAGESEAVPAGEPARGVEGEADVEGVRTHVFSHLEDAIRRAHEIATEQGSAVYVYDADGRLIDKYERYGAAVNGDAYHVIPWDEGWALKRSGEDGVFERFDTKQEAVSAGRTQARSDAVTLVVHYRSDEVQGEQEVSC